MYLAVILLVQMRRHGGDAVPGREILPQLPGQLLMEQVVKLLDGTGLTCGTGVDVMDNCLGGSVQRRGHPRRDFG